MRLKTVIHFRHRVGDGLHYVTDNKRIGDNGVLIYGDTSEGCILFNLDVVLSRYRLPTVDTLWNQVYPHDRMTPQELALILGTARSFTDPMDPTVPDNVADVLKDVRSMQAHELADLTEALLRKRGAVL